MVEGQRVSPVDVWLLCLTSLGALLAIIGVGGGSAWSDNSQHGGMWKHDDDYTKNEYQTTRAFSIIGAVAAITAVILSVLRTFFNAKSKTVRLAYVTSLAGSFLGLLISVAVWGDFAQHGDEGHILRSPGGKDNSSKVLHLGWAFWVTAVADICLFLAFLLYLMRKDFVLKEGATGNAASSGNTKGGTYQAGTGGNTSDVDEDLMERGVTDIRKKDGSVK